MSEQLHVEAASHQRQYIVHNVPIIDRGDREFNDVYVNFSGYFGRHGPQVFAAAPELLEALRTVLAEWNALYPSFPTSTAIEDAEFSGFQLARAAIAKATGEA